MRSDLESHLSSGDQTIEHLHAHGWMRVHKAFDCLGRPRQRRVLRDKPSTWTIERPGKLQKLKVHHAFGAVGSERLLRAVDAVLGTSFYEKPKRWGAIFIALPSPAEWGVRRAVGISTRTT
jgi:hypothetical protein